MNGDNRWLAAAVLVSLFVSGAVAGGLGVLVLRGRGGPGRHIPPVVSTQGPRRMPAGPRAFMPQRSMDRMARVLDLSDAQRDSVTAILRRQREAARSTLSELAPRLRATVDSADREIRALLTPDQRDRFDRMRRNEPGLLGRRLGGRRPGGGT